VTPSINTRNSIVRLNGGPLKWTPAELDNDLALWLDVWDSDFDLRTDANGNERVERWGDRSGSGNDATQATGSVQPTFSESTVKFESGNYFRIPPEVQSIYFLGNARIDEVNRGSGSYTVDFRGDTGEGYINPSFFNDSSFQRASLDGVLYQDDVDIISKGKLGLYWAENLTATNFYLSAFSGGAGDTGARNDVHLFLGLTNDLTDDALRKLEGWAAHKADRNGISEPLDNLPAPHPYKTEAPTI